MNLHFKVFFLTLLIACAFSLKGIGLNPIKPYHLNQGKFTSYLFSISPEEEVLTKAKIRITFPYEFDHSKLASNLQCMAKSASYGWKDVPCEYYSPAVIITLSTIKDEPTYVLVSQPVNPVIYTMSSYFAVCLMYDNTVTSCSKEFGKVVFPSSPSPNNGAVTPIAQSLNSNTVGQASTYQFTFGLSFFYDVGNTIRVKFPQGFTTTESPICQMAGTFNQVIKTFVWPDKRSIECQSINSTFEVNQTQVLKIIGIYNPLYAGNFGNTAEGFVIEILKGTTTISLEQIYPTSQIVITTGGLVGRIDQDNNFIKSKTKYTFYMTLQNPLTSTDYIQMKFPSGWILYNGQCTAISGLTMNGRTLKCINSTSPGYVLMKVNNFQSASVSNQIVLSILVGTPNTPGDYTIETITGNSFGVMDKMTTVVNLNSTYGTIDMLSINAITANAKVEVGKTGPLELTFFLNYLLPQTNVLTQGKFIMKIYPKIMLPNVLTNGVLKCYFFNNIPAKTCIWNDTESASYTKVTITTPQTVSFQYSQIPITLTTEGAVNDSMIGITIADVVTRYRFELEAYKQENASTPTEVYYTEYIADAINLPITTYSLTNEMNEYTHLRLELVGPYDFVPAVVKDIRFKIEFLNSGWATNLGYSASQIYKRFPCVLSESTAYPPTYNNKVVCDLYTYLDGPHASLTDAASRGPYILMYGFYPQLLKNYNYRLQLGKFLIGSSSNIDAKIRFSIIQETPDMLTKYIQLYYNEVTLFTTSSSAVTLQSNMFTTSMSNSQINAGNYHSHSYTVPSNGLAIIYEYDQSSTQSFTNQNFQCTSTNWCVSLGYPVNWIIEYKQSGTLSTSIASNIYFVNGVYADTFTGKARVFKVLSNSLVGTQTKNIMTSLYKTTFTYSYTPSQPTSCSFGLSDSFGSIYKNMEQYYVVTFYPATTLPSNGFVRLTLSTEMKFAPIPYCYLTNIPVLDSNLGLLCSLEDSRSTLKIWNIDQLVANGIVQIKVRIATELDSGASISPNVKVRTFRTLAIDTSLVDQRTGITLSGSPNSNLYTNPISFEIDNPRTVTETPRVNYIGRLEMKFRPSSSSVSTPASKIRVYFHDHPWNGGKFTTPTNNVADPLVCKLNRKRVACTYTLNPFNILMNIDPAGLNSGSDNIIMLDTEYISPDNGIKHPSQAGDYMTTLHFYDSSMNELEKTSFTHSIKASKLRNLVITSTVNDVGVQNMFKVDFQTFSSLTVNANNHATIYSRMFIEFPTKDSLGNNLFAADLGGYKLTGEYVGCHFSFPNNSLNYVRTAVAGDYIKCRLIKSEVPGDPVRVEVINQGAFTSSIRWMTMYIAKVFNPSIAVTSVPISIKIQHIDVATNNIYELYYDTYDVFMNSQNPTLQQANATRGTRGDSYENGKDIGDQGVFAFDVRKIGSVGITASLGYYMALDLTDSMKPMNNQNTTAINIYCNGSYFYGCYIFPQINYVVVWSYSDNYYAYLDVKISDALSQVDTFLVTRIWQNGRFMGFYHIQLYSGNWFEIKGDIYSYSFSTVGNTWERAIGRRRTEMIVSFRTDNGIPAGGSIEIIWPTGVPKAYPHCRSMISQGSVLYAQGQAYNGQIGCMVQNTRNWVITSFQAVAQNSLIVIVGQIDMPNSYHYIGTRYIYTYNNTHPTDIRTNGFVIDYFGGSLSDIYVQNSLSWNVDSQITVQETLTLRTSYVGPLQFKLQLNENLLGPKQGRIVVRVFKKSTINEANGFAYGDKKYVCKIVQLQSNEETGCVVEKVQDDNNSSNQNIKFTLYTSSNMLSTVPYKVVLTTQEGIQPEGLTFPTVPGTYKVSVSIDADSNITYNIYNHLYLEVYGTPFKVLKVISMNTRPSEPNLLWIKLTPTTQILTTEQIIIDFPTKSTSGLVLFQDDLGSGSVNGSDIKVDVIGGDFTNTFMKCRLFEGDSTFSKSARIVCGAFQSSISNTQLLFFAIKFNNPPINGGRAHVSLPIFIYSVQQGKTYKKNFNVYDNAVQLRNDNSYNKDYVGDISTLSLQTSNGYIDMITRNWWDVTAGQYYILFFGFPLRKNGVVTNGCSWPGGGVYGNAYYHENIWAIVCEVSSNTISNSYAWNTNNVYYGNTRNLRISGFYTPWYYLSGSERAVTTYSFYTGDITVRGIYTDLYPNAGPKQASGPTFTMTPVHQASTQYAGARDDYTFEIIYSSTASNDISYMRKIAIVFPDSASEGIDFVLVGQDCVEATGSEVEIEECWIETGGRVIWIRPVVKTSYTSNMKIRIQTRDLAIRNPTNNRTVYWNRFAVKFYSWQNITEPTVYPLTDNNYCFLIINNINGALATSYSLNPSSYSVQNFDYISYPHQRYFEETPYQSLTHRAPIELKFRPNHDFTTQSSQYHNIKIYYPASFGDYDKFKIRDLQVFRPVCYLNNFRIRKCAIDTTNNYISMDFLFALTNNVDYHIKVSLIDPRNPDINGFLASSAITDLVLTYKLAGQSTVFYMQSDQFPTLFTLPTGIAGGPFRGITDGAVEYGHYIINQLNSINLVLTFNRTDITGLVFEIPLRDSAGTYLYPTNANFAAAFLNLENGATYPCGNNGFGAGGNPKCIILNGDNTKQGVPTRVIMTDFTYNQKMNCRFIFANPEANGAYFSVKVKAYGGTRSDTNLYGDKFMGEWNFMDIFQATTGTVDTNSYSRSYYRRPSQSPWRNNTEDYVFSKNYAMYANRMSLAQVLLYDNSSARTDKQFCEATLGSSNDYDDLLEYTIVSGGYAKKYAYFVTTWQGTTNVSYAGWTGWTLKHLKCRYYQQSYIAYFFMQKNSIQIATNSHDLNYPGTYGSITAPTVKYFDQTRRFSDSTPTYFTMEIDYTATLNSITNFEFRSRDAMVLLVTVSDWIIWNNIISCQLIGGIISTSEQNPAQCQPHSTNQIRIINVAGFESNPQLPASTNKRVKFMFKVNYLNGQAYSTDPTKVHSSYLYSNYDAMANGYQPIFAESSTLLNNCQYPNDQCYYSYGAGGGSGGAFSFDYLSDTAIRVSFKPVNYLDFAGYTVYNHYFRLQFHGFGYGAGCSISSVIAEITNASTPNPGSGWNNTLDFDTKSCDDNWIDIFWTSNRLFSENWGRIGLAENNTWNTTFYIILYIIVVPGSQDLPVMDHDYIFMSGTYNYQYSSNAWVDQVRNNAYLPIQSLASSATVSTLTDTREAYTQLIFQVKSLNTNIGSANNNYLLLAEFIGTSGWSSANDPFRSYTNTAKNKELIECKCLSGMGPLSSSTTSPYVDAKCWRRLPSITVGSGTFNNYAILIDHPALKTHDIKCYFPEFFLTSGMSLNVKFKRIYGDSYPVDIISGTTEYFSMYTVTAPTVTYAGTTPSMSSPYVYDWNSLSDNLYSSAVTVGTKFSGIYTLTGDWNASLTNPYLYLNLFKAGPIPVLSFCSDSNVYFECRVYSKLINVVVAEFKSGSATSFSMTQGSDNLYYPFQQSSVSTFDGFAYVGTTSWQRYRTFSRTKSNLAPISTNKFSVFTDKYGSSRYNYATNIFISMNINGKTLYNYMETGSKIEITFSAGTISHLSNCQVWVQNEMNVELTCEVSSGKVIVFSRLTDYSTSNNIFVSLGITNPNAASVAFSMVMYDYYFSNTRYSIVISRTTNYITDLTYVSNSQLEKSRIVVYPFKSRMAMTTNVPIRIRFNLPASPGSITYSGYGLFVVTNTQFSLSSKYLCYFKQYTSWTNLIQETEYGFFQAASCTSSGSTLNINPPKTLTVNHNYFYELIIMPVGISSGVRFNQAGFHQSNFEDINIVAYQNTNSGPWISAQQVNKLYQYEGNAKIGLQYIYYLSGKPTTETSLYLLFSIDFSAAFNYPDHYFEITLFDLTESAFVGYVLNDVIPCQLSSNFLSISNRAQPQCRLASADTFNNFVKIRIENIGNLIVGNYWVSLDDIVLPAVSGGDTTKKFDISIGYYRPGSNIKYENNFKEILVMDGTNSTLAATIPSLTFNNPASNLYGAPIVGTMSFTWPFDTSASDYESKISININGGFAASWANIDSLTFTDPTLGTYQILWVNKKLNKFIFKIPNKSSGPATISINNIKNPYPYQLTNYNSGRNIEMNVYNNYFVQCTQTVSQTVFTYFQKNPSIIYINQNIPTNTIDNYPSTEKTTSNGLVKLTLSVAFDQNTPDIILRQLDVIDITFTSGVTYIEECRAMKNDSTYVNTLTTCQTYYDGTNWHVRLYDITGSSLDIDWWVHVFAKLTSATLSYTFQISPKNGVPEYLTSYSTILSSYDSTKIIPTQLSWLNRKYVSWFYQNQIKQLEPNTGVFTPYFKFRFNTPIAFDGGSDNIYIYMNSLSGSEPFKSKTESVALICNFLPAISSERDFTVGYYSRCNLENTGSEWRWNVMYVHGGLPQGDYLFQLVETNIIDSAFYLPTTPTRTLIRTLLYRSESNSNHYDSFYIHSWRYFRKAEIVHTTTTVSDYDTLRITYTPQGSLSAYSTNREIVLRLSVHAQYLDTADGGIKSIFLDDNVAIESGQRFSEVVSNPNGNEVTTIQFAQYSNNYAPLRFNLAQQSAYTDNVEYIWRLPLLKNPSTAYVSLRYNLTLMQYPSSTNYGIVFNHYEIINDYYTEPDTSSVFTTSVINNLRDVQTVAGTDLSIGLDVANVATWDSVTFKLDKSKDGLIPSFSNCNDTSNYNYYYFHTLEMVLAQKKSAANTTTVGINALSSTRSYQSTFSFKWVRLFDSSNTKQRFNPITLKYSVPPTLTLTPFTSYSAATLSAVQGYERQGSTVYYKIAITTKIVTQGGEIRVLFDSTKFTSEVIGSCRVGSGFVKSSSYKQTLRCYRGSNGLVISGFNTIAASTALEIFFYIKSLVAVTSSDISVDIYGIYRDNSTRISNAVVQKASHTSSPNPTNMQRIEQTVTPYYRSFYSYYNEHHYYEIEGSFTLRSTNLAGNTNSILFTDPSMEQWGDRRMLVKKNSSAVTGWTEMILDAACTNECRWWLPNNYINTLTFEVGQQYVWRYTTQYYNKQDTSRENGYYFQMSGPQRFLLKAHTGSTYSEWGFEQFIPKYQPITYTLTNRYPAAGRQTMLDIQFDVDIDLATNDEIQLTLPTNNLLLDMFEPDLEGNVTTETYRYLDCRQWVASNNISTSRIACLLYFGDRTQDPPKPAKLSIRTTRGFNGYPNIYSMRLLVANVKNPSTAGMNTGIDLNINRDCANSGNEKCPWVTGRAYYVTSSATENSPATAATFSSNGNTVLQTSLTHTFVIPLTASLTSSGIIYIVYPENYQGVMPNDCSASNSFTCVSFPTRRWIVLYPGTTYSSSSVTVSISSMQNGYYSEAYDNKFKITVARPGVVGDVFYITAAALNPITSSISMSISATQTPNVYLRNYANTAIFYINYIFNDDRIKAIYIKAPVEVTSWTSGYCNASITSTLINTYPLRFECKVDETDSTFLKITRHSEQLTWSASWPSYTIKVHAKFTLAGFDAGQPILYQTMPNNTNLFYAYGSVNTTSPISKYYLSQTSQLVSISQHQVPIISQITFNQKSFAYRVARVKNKEVFYLLLRPTVGLSPQIGQMVFKVPDEFDYPGVFSHDNCFMLGRTKEDQPLCKQSREGGQTLIKLTPSNYNQEVKIIQLGSKSNSNWFTAPLLPGDFYNMTVELYSTSNVLLEKQTIDISPVYGEYFDIPSIQLNNILEANFIESVYDFTFVTGSLQIPPGAKTLSTSLTSELQFVFENYNAANSSNVFANDLKTGLKQGQQVGCVIKQGITALQNMRIKCILHLGTNSTNKPMISVINYDFIDPATTIKINFAAIQSLMAPLSNTISLGVKMYYNDARNSSTYLYILTPVLPKPTNAATLDSTRLSGWSWSFYTEFSGANVVLEPTAFSLRITVPWTSFYSGYVYSSTGQQDQFVLLKFTPKFILDPYNKVSITCGNCSDIEIFYATGIVRFRHTKTLSGSGYFYFNFSNFPTASYAITNYSISVVAEIYDNYRRVVQSSPMVYNRTVEKCTKFDFGVLSVSSLNGGEVDVEYLFSIKTNHYIPPNGAVSIALPASYGNMVTNNATCTLTGFQDTNAYCSINTPSRIDIYLNGSELSQNYSYKINIKGLQNPNEDSTNMTFSVSSYFESDIYQNKKICENTITPPAINVKNIRDCTLEWQPDFSNMYYNATYVFYVSCADQFRANSIAYIKLPSEFSTRNKEGDQVCSSYESTTLLNNSCTLKYINGSLVLFANLDATSQTSFSIITNFINPINNTYKASAFVMSKGVKYASTNEESLTILSNSYLTANTTDVFLLNNPKEGGLMSTYIFKITPIKSFSPENMAFTFPNAFNLDQGELNIGLCVSDVSNLFEQLTYDNIQRLINNVSSVAGVSLKLYPTFEVIGNTIFVKNITNQLSSSLWTYMLIRGVKNPSAYVADNFTVAYYIETVEYKALKWVYNYPLKYFISPPPNYLTIEKVQVSDYDLLYPSIYTFTFSSNDGNKVAIAGKKLSYVIVMPAFYKSTLWANTDPVCKFSNLATNSTCYSYESEIIITEIFTANATKLVLSISRILNPSLQTFCNTTDVTLLSHTFFKIRIIEVASNAFLFESSAVVDNSNCLKFTSLRIPITLEYSLIMVAGLTYNITYGLTKPASNLKINAYIESQNGFTFSPSMVQFNDYYTLRNTTTLYLRSDISAGTYTIKFNKYQSEQKTYFRNILPITITVIKADQTSLSRPTIAVQSMSVSTIGYAVDIPVVFSMPSSTEMTLFMTVAEESNQTLETYNAAFKDFSITPRIINIKPQASQYSFQIQHMQKVVPPPLTLSFKLTSLYPIIHNLTTERLYICFDQDPKFDVLEPPMRVRITAFLESCNNKDIGKPITNIKVTDTSGTSNKTVSSVKPVIISIEPKDLSSTSATLQVSLDSAATIYYLCQPSGYTAITDNSVIKAMNSTVGFKGTATSAIQSIYTGTASQINYKASIQITRLSPTLEYDIYAISESTLGQSAIMKRTFKTTDLSKGVVMKLSFKSIVDSLTIVKALERILRISPMRIKVLTSTYELQLLQNTITSDKNTPYYVYQVVISPDPTNDIKSPQQIVKDFINNTASKEQFKTEISDWANLVPVTYYELKVIKPRVLELPAPVSIYTYNCTFKIKMWERSNIFAVLIEEEGKAANTLTITEQPIKPVRVATLNTSERANVPTSNQIRSGLTKDNKQLNKYRYFSGTTSSDGIGNVFFDDLLPGTKYSMYITSSSVLPYEPSFLWEDSEVIKVSFTTLYNQALHNQEINTTELKKYNPSLAAAIERFQNNNNKKDNYTKLTKE